MKTFFRIVSFIMAVIAAISFAGCQKINSEAAEVALITDMGDIDDGAYNQRTWEGIEKYCDEKDITHDYYRAKFKDTEHFLKEIDKAVKRGAKILFFPSGVLKEAVQKAQVKYPKQKFVIIGSHLKKIEKNTIEINYSEFELGFLAGYAAVKSGYRNLGFQTDERTLATENYGFGFIQGAEYASYMLNLDIAAVNIKYNYAGTTLATPEAQARVQLWYESGTEVIFACGDRIGSCVESISEAAPNRWIIGSDLDRSKSSPTVVISAKKLVEKTVYDTLKSFYNGDFEGGKSMLLSCKDGGIDLSMDTSKLQNFTKEDCEHAKTVLAQNKYDIMSYFITAKDTINVPILNPSDFSAIFSSSRVLIEYVVN